MKLSSFLTQTAFWTINKELAHNIGRDEAFLLSDLISKYEYFKSINQLVEFDNENYFYATSESIENDTMFTYFQQKKLIANLEKLGLLKSKRKGIPSKLFFHIKEENISNFFKSSIEETSNLDIKKIEINTSNNSNSIYYYNKNKYINNNNNIDRNSKIKEYKDIFEEARKIYKGTKRGCNTEFEVFIKHKDWQEVLPMLKAAIQREIQYIEGLKKEGKFAPEYKHFKTWLNQRCWENEFLSADNKIINETELKRKKAMINQYFGGIE